MCEFFENPDLIATLHDKVPVSMPPAPGAWGFDIPLWVGLGTVGLLAALDAFSERASLGKPKCPICKGRCIPARFPGVQGKDRQSLAELEDLRHLYAHNYAGEADDEYFRKTRHVLTGAAVGLTCGRRLAKTGVRVPLGSANNINGLHFEDLPVSRPCPVEILSSRASPR